MGSAGCGILRGFSVLDVRGWMLDRGGERNLSLLMSAARGSLKVLNTLAELTGKGFQVLGRDFAKSTAEEFLTEGIVSFSQIGEFLIRGSCDLVYHTLLVFSDL